MTCPACEAAKTNPHTGLMTADCEGCQIRALANGLDYWKASKARQITPEYKRALRLVFGDKWEEGHRRIKALHDRSSAGLS